MTGRLITFSVEVIDVPDSRPYFKRFYPRGPISMSLDDVMSNPSIMYEDLEKVEIKEFERIDLRDAKGKDFHYYINFDEVNHAIPILKGLVDSKLKEVNKENYELRDDLERVLREKDHYKRTVEEYQKTLLFRLFRRIKKLFK